LKRGELYLVAHSTSRDSKKKRVFFVVSRQVLIDSRFSTVVCASIYSTHDGLSTQVLVGVDEGLKHDRSIHCDELVSLPKGTLTNHAGSLSRDKIESLNQSLRIALDLLE
jgi:mRNA interferase MazF